MFDLDRIRAAPQVRALEYHDTIGSTNDRALELVREGFSELPLLIVAKTQTAGRGRGSNRWWSAEGGLAFTYVHAPPADFDRARWPRLALVAAVAVCDVVEQLAGELKPGIRWPNDVHVAGDKISGILVEVPALPSRAPPVVLGLGLNVNNSFREAPDEVRSIGTSLADLTGQSFDLTEVLLRLLGRFEEHAARLTADDPALIGRWQRLCLLKGKRVTLRLGEQVLQGLCRGITEEGGLELDTASGPQRVFGGVLTRVE